MAAGPITFSYSAWIALFPELAGVSEDQATMYFNIATLYVRNDGQGPINDPNMLTTLLNLTTAHIAKLFSQQTNGIPTTGGSSSPSPIVGRISTASEGSVSVATELAGDQPASAAWWEQTQYGFAAWQLMKPFRTFRYLGPTRRRVFNPPAGYRGWGI